jgi:subtilisin-like proprotein convertase family protein/N-acetylneuraminic acid mutarotase
LSSERVLEMKLWTRRGLALLALAGIVPACGGGGGGGSSSSPLVIRTWASSTIGAAGGTLEILDTASPYVGTRLDVPAGALAQDTLISLGEVTSGSPSISGTLDVAANGNPLVLHPEGLTLNAASTLTIPYQDSDGDGRIDGTIIPEETMQVAVFIEQEGKWFTFPPEDSQVDPTMNRLVLQTRHFSYYYMLRSRLPTGSGIDIFEYQILNGTSSISGNDENAEIAAALEIYEARFGRGIRFQRTTSGTPDITFEWGDPKKYGPNTFKNWWIVGQAAAYTWHPWSSSDPIRIVFDDTIDWGVQPPSTFSEPSLRAVALHEIGHALGLSHYFPFGAHDGVAPPIMEEAAAVAGDATLYALYPDDVDRLDQIYFTTINGTNANMLVMFDLSEKGAFTGDVVGQFLLMNDQNTTPQVQVQYSIDGSTYSLATLDSAFGIANNSNLATSLPGQPVGTTWTYAWRATTDLPPGFVGTVTLRVSTNPPADLDSSDTTLTINHSGSVPPNAITESVTNISQTGATLNGTVNPNGLATSAYFEWGSTTSYGNTTPLQSLGNGTGDVGVSATLSGLTANTTYNFRLVASNAAGTTLGSNLAFTTPSTPPPWIEKLAQGSIGSPEIRRNHGLVWDGTRMVAFGGDVPPTGSTSYRSDTWWYDPGSNVWTQKIPHNDPNSPAPRSHVAMVWDGTRVVLFGGNGNGVRYNDVWWYSPVTNVWTEKIPQGTAGSPSGRAQHRLVWDGTRVILFGGDDNGSTRNDLWWYDPASNTWTLKISNGAVGSPSARESYSVDWDGSNVILFGGIDSSLKNDLWFYSPPSNSWSLKIAQGASGSPLSRRDHATIWSGAKMVLFGGNTGSHLQDLWEYDPIANSWVNVITDTAPGSPPGRSEHRMVWDGSRIILFAGHNLGGGRNDLWWYNGGSGGGSTTFTFDSSDVPKIIVPPPGVSSTLNVPSSLTISSLKVTVSFSSDCVSDVTLRIRSPQGTEVTLRNSGGGCGSMQTVSTTYPTPTPVSGPGSLSDFNGQNAQGTWTLLANDQNPATDSVLNSWSIEITSP